MNLHAIASRYVAAVNPMLPVTVQISDGLTTAADGSRSPSYKRSYKARAQVQAMSSQDLRQVDGLALQGSLSAIYLLGDIEGIVRPHLQGGDLITFPNGDVYLVKINLESWGASGSTNAWSKVACILQNQS